MPEPASTATSGRTPVLELDRASPVFDGGALSRDPIALRLMPGDCLLVETTEPRRAAAFADLCSGLLPLSAGAVRFLGLDWREVGDAQAGALRGRIGRTHARGAWTDARATDRDILLPRMHHTRLAADRLAEAATQLSRRFGLPGIPSGPPSRFSDADLARAACVRAFLGVPSLLLLENPVTAAHHTLLVPLIAALTEARERGAAAICLTRERPIWRPYIPYLTAHLRLHDHGLGQAATQ